ncbi:MAG: Ig-like domain-containing protein, partial [Bdellovibrionales bacterium]|nr:Ig-like domain-containing protein [Bdellovibrionales bacterium]
MNSFDDSNKKITQAASPLGPTRLGFVVALVAMLTGCLQEGSWIADSFLKVSMFSAQHSSLKTATTVVLEGDSTTVTLITKNNSGGRYVAPSGLAEVTFSLANGTSAGTFSKVSDLGSGTYSATFTGTQAGSISQVSASFNGTVVLAKTNIQVISNGPSTTQSLITASASTVLPGPGDGSQTTVTLSIRDMHGAPITTGGQTVVFTHQGGTSSGTFSAVTDNGDGTHTATFTGVESGSPTSIRATLNGGTVTTAAPTVQVLN